MLSYPPARHGTDADDYHGETIADPYRWLEATGDPEVAGWIKAQNDAPVLVRVETGTGHGAGKPTAKAIAAEADVLAFLDAVLRGG